MENSTFVTPESGITAARPDEIPCIFWSNAELPAAFIAFSIFTILFLAVTGLFLGFSVRKTVLKSYMVLLGLLLAEIAFLAFYSTTFNRCGQSYLLADYEPYFILATASLLILTWWFFTRVTYAALKLKKTLIVFSFISAIGVAVPFISQFFNTYSTLFVYEWFLGLLFLYIVPFLVLLLAINFYKKGSLKKFLIKLSILALFSLLLFVLSKTNRRLEGILIIVFGIAIIALLIYYVLKIIKKLYSKLKRN